MNTAFYMGSCRYMYSFKYKFTPRMHTTREIINFLHHCTFHTLGNRPLLGDLSVEWQRYHAQ
jgi:hypothetical protein